MENREIMEARIEKEAQERTEEPGKAAEAAAEKEEELKEREESLNKKEQEILAEEAALSRRKQEILAEETALHKKEREILAREAAVSEREGRASERERALEGELAKERLEKKKALNEEISQERTDALGKISEMISARRENLEALLSAEIEARRSGADAEAESIRARAKAEAERIRGEAQQEADERRGRLHAQTDAEVAERLQDVREQEKKLQSMISEYEEKSARLEEAQREAEDAKCEADRQLRRYKRREDAIEGREADLEGLVDARWSDREKDYRRIIDEKDKVLEELRDRASALRKSVDDIESFKASIGDQPAVIQDRIARLQKERDALADELATRAPETTQKELDNLKRDYQELRQESDSLRQENNAMKKSQEAMDAVSVEKHRLESLNGELRSEVEELRGQIARYEDRIRRLSAAEARTADRDARIAEIRSGYREGFSVTANLYEGEETRWLEHIGQQCDRYGITFPKRILYAFHTALKISDWSTIAVLAGVSGTGKSELPKLYAAFGGMNFISVPVQPSWDSQESMLGFFNSIDNRFEPEPLLKFLAQCTENEQCSPYMSIVLLDEMNLAHVEHYFAEFLSKLETRRGTAKNVPAVEVKLGAGVEPYELQLKRTILWTGTMNQDETTKSLSDKVLDRGLVIYFPRPHTLISRTVLKNLTVMIKDRQMLTEARWTGWIIRNLITAADEKSPLLAELDAYRKTVEEINDILEKVGRALGHRVWQSIENYILNYPTVSEILRAGGIRDDKKHTWDFSQVEMTEELKKHMRTAFEDQIVQKIMPKLRGIETRGNGRDRLQEIEDLLESKGFEKLKDDFENACTQGYGQFMWCSAKYIEIDDANAEERPEAGSSEE